MIFGRMLFGCMLQLAPFAFLCIYPFVDHLRYSKKKAGLLTAGLILLLSTLFAGICTYLVTIFPPGQALFNYANAVFMVCLIPCLIWYIFVVKEIWQKKLFVFFFTMTSALAMVSVCNILVTWFYRGKEVDGLPYYGTSLIILAAFTAVTLPLLWLLLKHGYKPVADGLSRKESGYLSLLSVLLFAVLASGLIPINYVNIYNPMSLFLYFALIIAVFVIYFVCFKLFFHTHEKLAVQRQLTQMEHQLALRDEQYRRITGSIENSRRIRHDFRHHIIVLQGFLTAGAILEAETYLNRYVRTLNEYEIAKFCDHTIVNTIVNHYRTLATENEIAFTARIDLPAEITVQNSDISVLLGNLLENAIEAALRAPEENRVIRMSIIRSGKMLAIAVDNGFDGRVKREGRRYLSLKENHTGIGLQSIKGIANKYNGGAEFGHEGLTFHASVMLGIPS
ncbi:hypothetical protein OXPF_29420 [Oxobacter pfennigii]|uniref:Sensor histidine kinase NatK-like C-terminal domain-containing protein n=1 Tax=Oxobacter pfennigii TaxID=36849 RepID=A0A0P8W6U2_9CLOT|nr:sensor histidine kinase [Oxobacter pfennigii]KPU43501.1 hypothetical protein OXPF_29420 [Oxobacter pfennigii]